MNILLNHFSQPLIKLSPKGDDTFADAVMAMTVWMNFKKGSGFYSTMQQQKNR